jgi:hypothetical protein
MATSYHPFPPESSLLTRRITSRLHLDGDAVARYRLLHHSSGTVEADGSRDVCLARAELMWWEAEAAPTSVVRYHIQDRAADLQFERWDGGQGRWEPDTFLTRAVVEDHLVG